MIKTQTTEKEPTDLLKMFKQLEDDIKTRFRIDEIHSKDYRAEMLKTLSRMKNVKTKND